MDFRELFLVLSAICLAICDALMCKCTQSSWKTPCEDGLCEVPTGESSCLMLDHPTSGRHYACSQSQLNNGECLEKVTKSGAIVKVCSCDTSDYCNFKMWPSETAETTPLNPQIGKKDQPKIVITRHNHLNSAISSRYNSLFSIFVFQLLPIVFCIVYIR